MRSRQTADGRTNEALHAETVGMKKKSNWHRIENKVHNSLNTPQRSHNEIYAAHRLPYSYWCTSAFLPTRCPISIRPRARKLPLMHMLCCILYHILYNYTIVNCLLLVLNESNKDNTLDDITSVRISSQTLMRGDIVMPYLSQRNFRASRYQESIGVWI